MNVLGPTFSKKTLVGEGGRGGGGWRGVKKFLMILCNGSMKI